MKLGRINILIFASIVVLVIILISRLNNSTKNTEVAQSTSLPSDDVHYHAGFLVYVDNELVDFSDLKYMHIKPCSLDTHEDEHDAEEEQIEKAHLHDGIGDVVHIHRPGAVWGDLFKNIGYEISQPLEAYINGEPVDNILERPIVAYDSIVIFSGIHSDVSQKLQNAVSKDHIIEAESASESCGS